MCALSLTLRFAAGWALAGTWHAGATAFLWAGLVHVTLLQHITWSIRFPCHMAGTRPAPDPPPRPLHRPVAAGPALVRESWHNGHRFALGGLGGGPA